MYTKSTCFVRTFGDFHFTTLHYLDFHFTTGHFWGFPLDHPALWGFPPHHDLYGKKSLKLFGVGVTKNNFPRLLTCREMQKKLVKIV